jgi:dihydrofolate reductase
MDRGRVLAHAWGRIEELHATKGAPMRKLINSTYVTLDGVKVISGDVATAITALKRAPGRDIVQYGFGAVTRLLLERGLLDVLRLWVHPLILATGRPGDLLFGAGPAVALELAGATTLSDGIVILDYRVEQHLERAS